jgi:biopolymer transport protein ExbD
VKPVAPKTRPLVEAGAASLSDIIMNLFIFFFIAFSLLATFEKQKKAAAEERLHDLELPASAAGAVSSSEQRLVVVELDEDGGARVDGAPVPEDGLTARLEERFGAEARTVVVRAHRSLSLGTTVAHLDRIWAAKPAGVSIATLAEASAGGAPQAAGH